MKNILFDINVILDINSEKRDVKFPDSRKVYELAKKRDDINIFLSSSSLDNIEFIKYQQITDDNENLTKKQRRLIARNVVKELLKQFKLAKTPAYMVDADFDAIGDSQIISSAIAIDAQVITRNKDMLEKYPGIAITAEDFLRERENTPHKIDFANLKKQYFALQPEIEKQMDEVLSSTAFIMGDKVRELELELQEYTQVKHALTCSSGTDALLLAMMALDIQPGDEIITTPFTFIATSETIALMKALPIFVDIDERTFNIDPAKIEAVITPKTKAIIPVSLYGQPADMDVIQAIADKHDLKVIIDGAQSFGSTYKGKMDSNLGDISTTSFFPSKPLGCFGDGGAVFTNDEALAKKMKSLRVHGQSKRYHHKDIGMGGRLDTLQAAVLRVKLKHYKEDLALRQDVAFKYTRVLSGKDLILPFVDQNMTSAWAQYSVRVKNRDELQAKLQEQQIPTAVHYPMPLHLQKCFEYLAYARGDFPVSERVSSEIISLPMNPYVSDEEVAFVSNNWL